MYTLDITLFKAIDLPRADMSFFGFGGKSDPYVTFRIDNSPIEKSSCKKNELNPVWDPPESFNFTLDQPQDKVLTVRVYDHDQLLTHDLLGILFIPLAPLLDDPKTYNRSVKDMEERSYDIDISDAFRKQEVSPQIVLGLCVNQAGKADQVLQLYENQRFHIVHKWTNDSSLFDEDENQGARQRWNKDEDAEVSSDRFMDVAPKVPEGMKGDGWTLDVSIGDDNGWVYAESLSGPWMEDPFSLAKVRRRRWINKCVAVE